MTTEHTVYVGMPQAMEGTLRGLQKRAVAALGRADKLALGDRTEALRFEAIHAVIDQLAIAAIVDGEVRCSTERALDHDGPSIWFGDSDIPDTIASEAAAWLRSGKPVIALRLPHRSGETSILGKDGTGPAAPFRRWQSLERLPRAAIRERFRSLILDALNGDARDAAIRPSGITNSVLTETLREFSAATHDRQGRNVPVRYVDNSFGPDFPLAVLDLTTVVPTKARELRFTLLSVRHVEMDSIVHGAWLRNSRISVRRPQGLTDQICFEVSLRQLRMLDPAEVTVIRIHQTGFEPAVVGFYRSVVTRLIEAPGSLCVIPYYYVREGEFAEGTPWATI